MAKKGKAVKGEVVKAPEIEDERLDKTEVLTKVKKMAKKYGKVANIELKQRDPYVPRALENKLRQDIVKMKAITANDLAARHDVRVSAMKKLLLTMEDEGLIERIASSSRLKVFNPVQ
ncbi:hypothetical protein [Candidatus Lokiarchaeum ossiferum]|uniref:hypothetical protein n=1 Tax=Candidatus Lokiarchaeum ossiferum TaxID=2951803 RepID=UPI00352D90C8